MWQAFQNQTGADLKIICKYQCLSKLSNVLSLVIVVY